MGRDQVTSIDCFPGSTAVRAGLEMGFWNFLATALQAIGLENTTAVRSGFIIQASKHLNPASFWRSDYQLSCCSGMQKACFF